MGLLMGSIEAKTSKKLKASDSFNKSQTLNAIVPPYASQINSSGLDLIPAPKIYEPNVNTKKEITGFEKVLNKKDFSTNVLGVNALDPNKMPGVFWGSTFYDLQTNGSMPERTKFFESGSKQFLQCLWMGDVNGTKGWPERGSLYEAIEVTNPANISADGFYGVTIEKLANKTVRTGWPSIVQFPDGSIGTPSHDSTPPNAFRSVIWTKNTGFKKDDFSSNILSNSNPLWARTVIDGKGTLHSVYTWTNNTNTLDKQGQIGYRRSTDAGKTWSAEIFFTGPKAFDGPQTNGEGADSYAMDAKDNKIVIAYIDDKCNFMYRKSEDNGFSWSAPTLILEARHTDYFSITDLGGGKSWITSDTVIGCGNMVDVILDSKNVAHFVAPFLGTYIRGIGTLNGSEVTAWDSDTARVAFYYPTLGFIYNYENSGQPSIPFGNSLGENKGPFTSVENRFRISGSFYSSYSYYPQLAMDKEDNLYCVYSGINVDDYGEVSLQRNDGSLGTYEGYRGHLYVTWKSTNAGYTWSDPKPITPNGADAIFPTLCNTVYKDKNNKSWLYITYSANSTPGVFVTTTSLPQEEEYIFTVAFPTDSLLPLNMVSVKENTNTNGGTYVDIMPNPVTSAANVKISGNDNDIIENIAVYDIFGNKVFSLKEGRLNSNNQILPINVNMISSGMYSINMTVNGKIVTKLFSVVK
jgi:hypothetical protein